MSTYIERLDAGVRRTQTAALVGLDPRWDQLPESIQTAARAAGGDAFTIRARAYEHFCRQVLEVVAPLVPAVKPQSAFFEECGPAGVAALARVIRAARDLGLVVICDAKRGDIGSTAEAYADAYLAGADPDAAPFAADALTINPYMGLDTLAPFIERAGRVGAGLYVLVRTSNPGAGDFQDRQTDAAPLFHAVAEQVERLSDAARDTAAYGLIGAVVGATYPDELRRLRGVMPHVPLLVPGYGSQGGTSADVAGAFTADGGGALVNSSRGILFGWRKGLLAEEFGAGRWQDAVAAATHAMRDDLAAHTACGRLRDA